jgi:hypothetical protein
MKRREILNNLILFIIIIKLSGSYKILALKENLNSNMFIQTYLDNCSLYNLSDCSFCGPGKIFNMSKLL